MPEDGQSITRMRADHVGPQQAAQRMVGGQMVARGRREGLPADQVCPGPMSNQRRVGCGGTEGDPHRQGPMGMTGIDGAEFALNVDGLE